MLLIVRPTVLSVGDSKILSSSADAPSAVKDDGGSTIRDKGFNGTVELEWLAALAGSVAVSQSEMSQLSERSYHSEKAACSIIAVGLKFMACQRWPLTENIKPIVAEVSCKTYTYERAI
ncbi:hypothetical protein OUZ56_003527 [Daphnia magna]|uniref:Uncharacterized protein n=1 Tax=Daphnia magna TaxID=35525 RepID=A0ABR0A8Z6_9CRUS|nr:hypothetical protein OUZ56_003527 [Daphnia magna]